MKNGPPGADFFAHRVGDEGVEGARVYALGGGSSVDTGFHNSTTNAVLLLSSTSGEPYWSGYQSVEVGDYKEYAKWDGGWSGKAAVVLNGGEAWTVSVDRELLGGYNIRHYTRARNSHDSLLNRSRPQRPRLSRPRTRRRWRQPPLRRPRRAADWRLRHVARLPVHLPWGCQDWGDSGTDRDDDRQPWPRLLWDVSLGQSER